METRMQYFGYALKAGRLELLLVTRTGGRQTGQEWTGERFPKVDDAYEGTGRRNLAIERFRRDRFDGMRHRSGWCVPGIDLHDRCVDASCDCVCHDGSR